MDQGRMTLFEIRESIDRVVSKLTPKRKKFADEYMANGSIGNRAYMSAFGTKNPASAAAGASKLLRRSDIGSYIDLCKLFTTDELLNAMTVSRERVLDEEAKLAFIDIRKMFDDNGEILPPKEWPDEMARAAAGVEIDQRWDSVNERWQYRYKIKLNDKGRALGRLETVLGMNKNPDMNDTEKEMMKSFLQSIDGDTRGSLPSEADD